MIDFIDEMPTFIVPDTQGEVEAELRTYNLMRKSLESYAERAIPCSEEFYSAVDAVREVDWRIRQLGLAAIKLRAASVPPLWDK